MQTYDFRRRIIGRRITEKQNETEHLKIYCRFPFVVLPTPPWSTSVKQKVTPFKDISLTKNEEDPLNNINVCNSFSVT